MSSFSCNTIYKFSNPLVSHLNSLELYRLYMPIISNDAIRLYLQLCSDVLAYESFKFSTRNLSNLFDILNINIDDFTNARENLEAVGLIKTYANNSRTEIVFEINQPLCFDQFISNQKFKKLLVDKIGEKEFSFLELIFNKNDVPSFYEDISQDIDNYYENIVKDTLTFDFDKLYKNLSSTTSINIIINDNVKELINRFFVNKTFTFEQIESFVYKSIIKENNDFIISHNLLVDFFAKNDKTNIQNDFNKNIKIQRQADMFLENCSIASLNKVYKDYSSFTSEQYFANITSTSLTEDDYQIISDLRNQFNLSDALINIMIDYSLDKTYHVLNDKYLKKIARSFKLKNIDSLDKAYEHLMNWNKPIKKTNRSVKQTKFDNSKVEKELDKSDIDTNVSLDEKYIEEEIVDIDLKW